MPGPDHDQHPGAIESDARFPSGPWTGMYLQWDSQSRQRLLLEFKGGSIRGSGRDPAGDFAVHGSYDVQSGRASLFKCYPGYRVEYHGASDGDGIEGGWTIRYGMGMIDSGRFHIWPDASAINEHQQATAAEPVPTRA